MKKLYVLSALMLLFLSARSQKESVEPEKSGDKFFFGFTYSFLHADMKLLSMTKHSVWADQDLGTKELTKNEIDTINSFMDYTEMIHNLSLSAGMVFLNKPGNHWYIDGKITVGFAIRKNTLLNTENDNQAESKHYSPSFGLGFNFKYLFNDKWALNLGVSTLYFSSKINNIDENIFPDVYFLDEKKENKLNFSYTNACFMACYTVKKFTIQAGPGFYYLFNQNKYHIVRTSSENGATFEDYIETTLRADMFIEGCIRADWRISGHFLITAGAGIGKDIYVNAGLIYYL